MTDRTIAARFTQNLFREQIMYICSSNIILAKTFRNVVNLFSEITSTKFNNFALWEKKRFFWALAESDITLSEKAQK
jgi:hypothetical protein